MRPYDFRRILGNLTWRSLSADDKMNAEIAGAAMGAVVSLPKRSPAVIVRTSIIIGCNVAMIRHLKPFGGSQSAQREISVSFVTI